MSHVVYSLAREIRMNSRGIVTVCFIHTYVNICMFLQTTYLYVSKRVAEFYVLIMMEKCAFPLMQESDALYVCVHVCVGCV